MCFFQNVNKGGLQISVDRYFFGILDVGEFRSMKEN